MVDRGTARPRTRLGRGFRRWLAVLLVAGTVGFGAGPLAAGTALAATEPTEIRLEGTILAAPISVRSDRQHDLFKDLFKQVNWMVTTAGTPMKVDPATLGPLITLTVRTDVGATSLLEVYPVAAGGPRAHRPAAQPAGKVAEAWFYAPVNLPSVLRAAGVPLVTPTGSGQLPYDDPGGYQQAGAGTTELDLATVLGKTRTAVLSALAIVTLVLALLFAAARRSRRRYRAPLVRPGVVPLPRRAPDTMIRRSGPATIRRDGPRPVTTSRRGRASPG